MRPIGAGCATVAPMFRDVSAQPGTESRGIRIAVLGAAVAMVMAMGAADARAEVGVSVSTPAGEAGNATVTVTRTGLLNLSATTVTITTAPGTATPGEDYVPTPSPQTVSFGALENGSKTASVALINDPRDEPNQTFTVTIAASGGEAVAPATATATIHDDDPAPVLALADLSTREGTGAAATPFTFTVDVGVPSEQEIKVTWTAAPQAAGATNAKAPEDFTAATGQLTIPAGARRGTFVVSVVGDNVDEPDETFAVTLSAPVNADLAGTGARPAAVGTIANDDIPTIVVATDAVREGDAGTALLGLPVTLSNPSTRAITAEFATGDVPAGTAGGATAGSDYDAISGTLSWEPGDTTAKTISVVIHGDTVPEPDEIFVITLSAVGAAVQGPPAALGGIINDDGGTVTPGQAGAGTGTGFPGALGRRPHRAAGDGVEADLGQARQRPVLGRLPGVRDGVPREGDDLHRRAGPQQVQDAAQRAHGRDRDGDADPRPDEGLCGAGFPRGCARRSRASRSSRSSATPSSGTRRTTRRPCSAAARCASSSRPGRELLERSQQRSPAREPAAAATRSRKAGSARARATASADGSRGHQPARQAHAQRPPSRRGRRSRSCRPPPGRRRPTQPDASARTTVPWPAWQTTTSQRGIVRE